jgi:hypothetical protein
MILKQVIKYTNANAIEATWVDRIQLPDFDVPEQPAELDEEGNEITPAVPASVEPGGVQEIVRLCRSYADVQMQDFRDDVAQHGGDIDEYEDLIAEVEADIVPPPAPTSAQIKSEIIASTQERLNVFARTRYYDGILSLCTYATSPNPRFQSEGQYGVMARDSTWAKLYEILEEVEAGERPMPTGYADVEPELPILQWPIV